MRIHGWLFLLIPFCAVWLTACAGRSWEVRTYPLGQKVTIGHLTYLGLETQWLPALGEGMTARVAQSRFLLVRISVTNGGTSDAPVPNFSVEDNTGRRFDELADANGVPDWIGALRTLAPADTLVGNAAFDVPAGHYTLHILDEEGQHEARLDLPLSFRNESGETPAIDVLGRPQLPGRKN